ncbi:MAG: hypothetical protein QXR14_05795 [Sulfolobales archaeon]
MSASTAVEKDLGELIASGKLIYDYERGEIIDPETGLVIEEGLISQAREWREYSPEDRFNRSRIGPQITFKVHDGGLTSYIDPRGSTGKKLNKLQTSTRRPRDHRVRKEIDAKMIMNDTIAKMGLPGVVAETVGMLIKEAAKNNLLRKNMIASAVGAMIIEVCKTYGIPIDIKKLRETLSLSERDIHNATKRLAWAGVFNDLKRKLREKSDPRGSAPLTPASYIPKISGSVGLSDDIVVLSKRIIDLMVRYEPTSTSGKNPEGTAAAAVYLASILLENKKPQKSIAEALGISEVTIRNRYRDIIDNLDIIVYI